MKQKAIFAALLLCMAVMLLAMPALANISVLGQSPEPSC